MTAASKFYKMINAAASPIWWCRLMSKSRPPLMKTTDNMATGTGRPVIPFGAESSRHGTMCSPGNVNTGPSTTIMSESPASFHSTQFGVESDGHESGINTEPRPQQVRHPCRADHHFAENTVARQYQSISNMTAYLCSGGNLSSEDCAASYRSHAPPTKTCSFEFRTHFKVRNEASFAA
jgi:hypothetical protein